MADAIMIATGDALCLTFVELPQPPFPVSQRGRRSAAPARLLRVYAPWSSGSRVCGGSRARGSLAEPAGPARVMHTRRRRCGTSPSLIADAARTSVRAGRTTRGGSGFAESVRAKDKVSTSQGRREPRAGRSERLIRVEGVVFCMRFNLRSQAKLSSLKTRW
jgi:hypothetical protein